MHIIDKWKQWATGLKKETYALYLAYRSPKVSIWAKVFVFIVVAYAFSPIDLIPDFIPILGYLDDFLLVPLGVFIAVKLIPQEVYNECKMQATEELERESIPSFKATGAIIIAIWVSFVGLIVYLFWKHFH